MNEYMRMADRMYDLENQMKQLEEENAELKNKLEHRNCLDCSNHSSKLRMRNLDLEKENAELKKLKRECETSLCRAEYQYNYEQLTKAKDHIKKLLECLKQDTNDPQTNYYVCQYMDKAEQFLNSEVEK